MPVQAIFKKAWMPAIFLFSLCLQGHSQPISGIWKGKMGNYKVELKLIRKGDSLIGTSYYYDSKSNYLRYSIKGYFDNGHNDVIWWDDVLIEKSGSSFFTRTGQQPLLAVADFNCPGEGIMKLDGNSSRKDDDRKEKKELHLVKGSAGSLFPDEWDFLIDNYVYGVMHPEIVDSIEAYAFQPVPKQSEWPATPQSTAAVAEQAGVTQPVDQSQQNNPALEKPEPAVRQSPLTRPEPAKPVEQTNEERLTSREKILQQVIPVKGDSLELRFYDNAEIDGDSIAVFLNGRLLKEHILLAEEAYIMKIAIKDLQADNELVMVAENLGTIPPNTSLMVAIVEDKRYEAHLQSTMGSSALVRLVKP
jgi:hypothetical protein